MYGPSLQHVCGTSVYSSHLCTRAPTMHRRTYCAQQHLLYTAAPLCIAAPTVYSSTYCVQQHLLGTAAPTGYSTYCVQQHIYTQQHLLCTTVPTVYSSTSVYRVPTVYSTYCVQHQLCAPVTVIFTKNTDAERAGKVLKLKVNGGGGKLQPQTGFLCIARLA